MERRVFTKEILSSVLSFSLLDTLFTTNAFSNTIDPITKHWAKTLNEFCSDLRKETISPIEWQGQIENLYKEIELSELLKFIDFDNLIKGFEYPDLGVNTKTVKFPKLEGLPERTKFVKKIFGMKKNRAIIPHGHSNMASAHLIIKGEMHLRQYEKIRKEDNKLIIKPSIDKTFSLSESSSISDEKNNVHWFVARTETAFTFDVIMLDLKGEQYDIQNLDIYEKEDLKDGTMIVPVLDVQAALNKYGNETHH